MSRPLSDVILVGELEDRLRVSGKTILRWVRQGVFPRPLAGWPGGRHTWDRGSVERWLADRGVSPSDVGELATAST